jgi:hypothetical protein
MKSRMHRYVSHNQKLAWMAVSAIERGDLVRLGSVLTDAQQIFDDCAIDNCPSQLTSPRLHAVLSNAALRLVCFFVSISSDHVCVFAELFV